MQNDIKPLLACCHLQYVLLGLGGLSRLTVLIVFLYPGLFVGVMRGQDSVLKYLYMPSKPNYSMPAKDTTKDLICMLGPF